MPATGAAGPAPPPAPPAEEEPRRRLHPLSPLLHGAKSIAVIVAALSWQTLGQVGLTRFALGIAALAVIVVVFSVVGWLNTGYHVVGKELRIQDGLLWRRNRAIPLERLQSVELRRPLLAQLTGLAELRLEVVGGGKTEAPLAYLTVKDAAALRTRLLALAGRTQGRAAGETPASAPPPAPERPLFRVANSDLLISQLLTPQAFFIPIGVAFVITQTVLEGTWTFIGIASTVTAMAGVLLHPIRRVLGDWDFRLARDADGRLILRYGLTETRSQVVPRNRVQSVHVTWPLLWRMKRWLNLRLDIAGVADPDSRDAKRSDRLLPVGDLMTGRALLWDVWPGVDLLALPTYPPPERARWLHPIALKYFGVGLTDQVLITRWGVLTRELSIVPYERLQSVRVVQGPVQRLFRLATVYADTAGGRQGIAHDRDIADAWVLADQLAVRARLARGPAPEPTAPPAPRPPGSDFAEPPAFGPPSYLGPPAGGPAAFGPPTGQPAAFGPPTGQPAPFGPPTGQPAAFGPPTVGPAAATPAYAPPPADSASEPVPAPPGVASDPGPRADSAADDAYWQRPPSA